MLSKEVATHLHDISRSVTILRERHPFEGRALVVISAIKRRSILLLVVLPDGRRWGWRLKILELRIQRSRLCILIRSRSPFRLEGRLRVQNDRDHLIQAIVITHSGALGASLTYHLPFESTLMR